MIRDSRSTAEGEAISEEVDRLVHAQQIRDLLVLAASAADRRDDEALRSSFWPDATVRHGTLPWWSRDDFTGAWATVAGACATTKHHLFNDTVEVDGDGDVAHVETYYIAVFVPKDGGDAGSFLPFCGAVPPGEVGLQGGRCVDRLERRDGAWRIASRQVCGDWFATAPAGDGGVNRGDHPLSATAPPEALDRVDELLAREAIRDCVYRYGRGIDRADAELLASVFVDPGEEQGFIDSVLARSARQPIQCHYLTNLQVNLGMGRAQVEAYFISAYCWASDPPRRVDLLGGRDHFELVEEGSQWRIAARTVYREWHATGDGRHIEAFHQATGNKSRRSRDDASYDPLVSDALSRTLADLVDREGVRDALSRYARGADRLDRALIESAHIDVAPQFVDYMFTQARTRPIQDHCWTNLRVQLAGEGLAYIEAYYVAAHGYVDGATAGFIDGTTSSDDINLVAGRYVRWFEKVDGRWGLRNLSSAKVYPPPNGGLGDWHAMLDASGLDAYLTASGNAGRHRGSRDDPSYWQA